MLIYVVGNVCPLHLTKKILKSTCISTISWNLS